MKILVTGGAGFIGSHLAEQLAQDGHEVTVLDSLSDFLYPKSVKEQNIKEVTSHGIRFIPADLVSDDLLPIVKDQQIVINQAAVPGLEKSWTHLDQYARSNIVGLGRLLEASVKAHIERFIQVSTSSVYGKDAVGIEDSPKNPFSPYGVTKLSAENLVKAYEANFSLNSTILRYFSVYGPRQRPDMAFHKFIDAIQGNKAITIFGDGHQSRSNTYVGDIVAATIKSLRLNNCPEEKVFNIAGSENWKLIQVIEKIENILGKKASIRYEPNKHGDQQITRGDTTKAKKFLSWEAQTSLDEGLAKQVQWQLKR
jgi:UDP-glucuronate 4-epimerase